MVRKYVCAFNLKFKTILVIGNKIASKFKKINQVE